MLKKNSIYESVGADDITDPSTGKYYNGSNNGYAFIFFYGSPIKEFNSHFFIGDKMTGHGGIVGELAYKVLHGQGLEEFQDYKENVQKTGAQSNIVYMVNDVNGTGRGGAFHKSSKNKVKNNKGTLVSNLAMKLLQRDRDVNGRLFINGDKVEGFDGYNIVAIHRPKQHLTHSLIRKLGELIQETKGLAPETLAFKLNNNEYVPYEKLLERQNIYDISNTQSDNEDYSEYLKGGSKKFKPTYTEKQLQKLRDYGQSPNYSREGEYKYLKGDDKNYYGTKEWQRLKYADKPGYMTQAEYKWRTSMDESKHKNKKITKITENDLRRIVKECLSEIILRRKR